MGCAFIGNPIVPAICLQVEKVDCFRDRISPHPPLGAAPLFIGENTTRRLNHQAQPGNQSGLWDWRWPGAPLLSALFERGRLPHTCVRAEGLGRSSDGSRMKVERTRKQNDGPLGRGRQRTLHAPMTTMEWNDKKETFVSSTPSYTQQEMSPY